MPHPPQPLSVPWGSYVQPLGASEALGSSPSPPHPLAPLHRWRHKCDRQQTQVETPSASLPPPPPPHRPPADRCRLTRPSLSLLPGATASPIWGSVATSTSSLVSPLPSHPYSHHSPRNAFKKKSDHATPISCLKIQCTEGLPWWSRVKMSPF